MLLLKLLVLMVVGDRFVREGSTTETGSELNLGQNVIVGWGKYFHQIIYKVEREGSYLTTFHSVVTLKR